MTISQKIICFFITFMFVFCIKAQNIDLQTQSLKVVINEKGELLSFYDRNKHKEYISKAVSSPILSIRQNGKLEFPISLTRKGDILNIYYKNDIRAQVKTKENQDYITFELIHITKSNEVQLIIWGPYPTRIGKSIGESVGVVQNKDFAIGIQALNMKTLGGYPTEENDIEPAFDIFATENIKDISSDWKSKKHYRGQTAKPHDFGSTLQAYCRNRNKDRIISNWAHTHYMAPAFNDGGIIGSKIALFGCMPDKTLELIGKIEVNEGLPHPTIDGEWAKTARQATASYLIIGFNEQNLDRALTLTRKAGLKYLYHGDPFETWGHFKLNERAFPDNWKSMKRCVQRAKKQNIRLGLHTLSNFITINDPYVSPIPDKRLAKVGKSILTKDIASTSKEIFIESPLFFNQMKNNSLHAVVIENEIIRYKKVSENKPWKLIGCIRGAYGTRATTHKKGSTIGKLMDHSYNVFLGNEALSEEIAKNIAHLFNKTGLMQISFDGLEGVWSTGMGQYARSLFTKTWFDNLKPELKGKVINDASNPGHYNWHINTRYNWGEPWYAGFRESQTSYRLMNQDFYRRNLLPAMLGWFSMSPQTSIEDVEWLLARSAAFDAGFAFNLSFDTVNKNGQSDTIFRAIKNWETARMANAFSSEQKLMMEDIKKEFHLEPIKQNEWKLFPYNVKRFIHEHKKKQPGEPLYSFNTFSNPYHEQSLQFMIHFLQGEKEQDLSVKKIIFEINNYSRIEIPVNFKPLQWLKLNENKQVKLFDENWNILKTIDINEEIPLLSTGENTIIFEVETASEINNKFKIEIRTVGMPKIIKSRSDKNIHIQD